MTNKKGALRGSAPKEVPDESKSSFLGRTEASADERHAELLERAAQVVSSGTFTNPAEHILAEALRVLLQDCADWHRYLASVRRVDGRLLFDPRRAEA
jgi:hypothetical protein